MFLCIQEALKLGISVYVRVTYCHWVLTHNSKQTTTFFKVKRKRAERSDLELRFIHSRKKEDRKRWAG